MKLAREIIIKPVVSEKSYDGIESNKYTFEIDSSSNKIEVRKAIEEIFNVTVLNVNTSHVKPKEKRQRANKGMTRRWKKAVVTLKEGDKIEFFESK